MKVINIQNTQITQKNTVVARCSSTCNAPSFGAKTPSKIIDGILKNKVAQKVFQFASDSAFGFDILTLATTCILMRPVTILLLPGSDKDDKKYLAAKSVISSVIANAGRLAFCLPLKNSLEHLGEKSEKNPGIMEFPAKSSKEFKSFNYVVNKGFAALLAIATSALMAMAVAKIMAKILPPPKEKDKQIKPNPATSEKELGGSK